jgi:hypothetical protein
MSYYVFFWVSSTRPTLLLANAQCYALVVDLSEFLKYEYIQVCINIYKYLVLLLWTMIIFPVWEFLRLYTAAKTSEISTAKQKTIEQRDNQRSKNNDSK